MKYENVVFYGPCLDILRQLPDNTYDSIVMDPPYGLGTEPTVADIIAFLQGADLVTGDFMNKKWDIPSVPTWKELFRVLKPGGHVLSFGGTRTWDLISLGARAAGFEYRDTIADDFPALRWAHGQGFPKSHNIEKAVEKTKAKPKKRKKGEPEVEVAAVVEADPETFQGQGTALKPSWEPIIVLRKPVEGTIADNVLKYGTGAMHIDACRVKHSSKADFEAHKAMVDAIKARGGSMDNSWKNSSDLSGASDVKTAGRWPPNTVMVHADGCRKVGTTQAKAPTINRFDDGMKPFGNGAGHEYTSVSTGDENGEETLAVWRCEDGCPVAALDAQSGHMKATLAGRADPTKAHDHPDKDVSTSSEFFGKERTHLGTVYADEGGASRYNPQFQEEDGTWNCVEGCPVKALDTQSGVLKSGTSDGFMGKVESSPSLGDKRAMIRTEVIYGDSGGASRFTPQFEGQAPVEVPFFYTGKATKRETSLDGAILNNHPTKKPLALMRWLVKLVTAKGGLVLDPYCGSGSTLHAALEEDMRYTGIEKDPEFHAIASKRMEIVSLRSYKEEEKVSEGLFDGFDFVT